MAIKHGHNRKYNNITPTYRAWACMLNRCRNPKRPDFPDYGGRGIKVCEQWLDFRNFLASMGERPSPKHSLDRINNTGHYEPSNCRWATLKEQARNKRNSHLVTHDGKTLCISEWAEITGLSPSVIFHRLKKWTAEKSLTTPVRAHKPYTPRRK